MTPSDDERRLEVVPLSEHQWRVCDHRFPATDGRRLLGVIEDSGDGFEVLVLTPRPVTIGPFQQWDAAISALRACCQVAADAASVKQPLMRHRLG